MSEWHCQVVRIEKIEKHPNADNLSIAIVESDYPVIIKTGQYSVGDLVAYIKLDTIVPDTEQFYFLCPQAYEKYEEDNEIKTRALGPKYPVGSVPEKNRIIKAKKIRSVYSMGLLVDCPEGMNEGDSIVEHFGLKKWVEEVDDDVVFANAKGKNKGCNAAKPPSGWAIDYYDLESIRKYLKFIENEQDIILTEKLNGCQMSACHDGNQLFVKSRNYYKKFDVDDQWIDASIRYDLENKLKQFPMLALYFELTGAVKKFRYTATIENGKLLTNLYCFDILNVKNGKFLDYDEFKNILNQLELPTTPILYRGPWLGKEEMYKFAEGQSTLNLNTLREGFVLRLSKERFEPKLGGRVSLKLVGEGYTLNK